MNSLQWVLAAVLPIKLANLCLSSIFWHSCINHQVCSLWLSFGIFVTGAFFQTASFVSFMLISHGYSVMYERLQSPDRRITAAMGGAMYLTLVCHRASVPYFTVFLVLNHSVWFYMIFRHVSDNLLVLRDRMNLAAYDEAPAMHDAMRTKYSMFKKFQGIMQVAAVVEILIHIDVDEAPDAYWFRLLVREWAQICIFLYIWWIFRTQQRSPYFSVIPTMKSKMAVPPIHSIMMDASTFSLFASQEWHVGVPASISSCQCRSIANPLLIIVQQPPSLQLEDLTSGVLKQRDRLAVIKDQLNDGGGHSSSL